ncbi:hypothetical protein GXW82_18450 [Streptacidiphilus sp. 4-A2]|nr:hypothetical protein [Streptacidiphilus sp. 4-A2]
MHWYAVGTLITVLASRGRVAEALALSERYDFHAPYSAAVVFPDAQTVRGGLLLLAGDFEQARSELAGGARLDARQMRNPGWCSWQRRLARAVDALGDGNRHGSWRRTRWPGPSASAPTRRSAWS